MGAIRERRTGIVTSICQWTGWLYDYGSTITGHDIESVRILMCSIRSYDTYTYPLYCKTDGKCCGGIQALSEIEVVFGQNTLESRALHPSSVCRSFENKFSGRVPTVRNAIQDMGISTSRARRRMVCRILEIGSGMSFSIMVVSWSLCWVRVRVSGERKRLIFHPARVLLMSRTDE